LSSQVYRPTFDNYLIRKSIHTNRLLSDVDGSLNKALQMFLHNGVEFRVDLVPLFVKHLEHLHYALSMERKFDFVASSVLLMYEGEVDVKEYPVKAAKVDVRLIDFDHTKINTDTRPHRTASEGSVEYKHKHTRIDNVPLHGSVKEDPQDANGVVRGVVSLIHVLRRLLLTSSGRETPLAIVQPSLLRKKGNDVEPRRHRSHSDPLRIHQTSERKRKN